MTLTCVGRKDVEPAQLVREPCRDLQGDVREYVGPFMLADSSGRRRIDPAGRSFTSIRARSVCRARDPEFIRVGAGEIRTPVGLDLATVTTGPAAFLLHLEQRSGRATSSSVIRRPTRSRANGLFSSHSGRWGNAMSLQKGHGEAK